MTPGRTTQGRPLSSLGCSCSQRRAQPVQPMQRESVGEKLLVRLRAVYAPRFTICASARPGAVSALPRSSTMLI